MFKDITVIDDFLENPFHVLDFLNKQTFYKKDEHIMPGQSIDTTWSGKRTNELFVLNKKMFVDINNSMFMKWMNSSGIDDTNFDYQCSWRVDSYFHRLEESDIFSDDWFHEDKYFYASVLYLSPKEVSTAGTIIYKGKEKVFIENRFNRLVIYRADYKHAAAGGFGENENSRQTLISFVKEFGITVSKKG